MIVRTDKQLVAVPCICLITPSSPHSFASQSQALSALGSGGGSMWKGDRQGSSGCPCFPNTPALSQQHGLGWTASCPAEQVLALCGGCFLCACPGLALCGQRCWDGPGDGSALSILNVLPLQGQRVACEVLSQEGQLWHCQENMCQRGGG